MREITKPQLIEILNNLGIQPGDGLLVHSALQFLGKPQGGVEMYAEALQNVIGPEGTIAVPTFNFDFARGEDYDPATAPAIKMGVFSEHVRQLPDVLRSTHPMQSLGLLGGKAAALAALDTPCAFDDGSAFDRMLDLDFKLLLLGANIQAVSMIHHSEQRANVPYRYWKDFSGRILRDGTWGEHTYRMFVRDLEIDAQLEIYAIRDLMLERGQWEEEKLNFGGIATCTLKDFVSAADELFARDPWIFLTNRPAGV